MAFCTKSDFDSTIHSEIIDVITRNDDNLVAIAVNEAISFMSGYLANRYNTTTIFAATGSSRNPIILSFLKDIAVYNMHCIHNPAKLPQIRTDRYNAAKAWLKEVSAQQINPPDLPVLETEGSNQIIAGGNTRRISHF